MGCPGTSGSAPRQLISTRIRRRKRKSRVFFARLGRAGLSERFFDDFPRFSFFSQNVKSLFRTTPASKNRGSALRAASRVARASQLRKTSKIGQKWSQNRLKSCLGRSGAAFSADFRRSRHRNFRNIRNLRNLRSLRNLRNCPPRGWSIPWITLDYFGDSPENSRRLFQ